MILKSISSLSAVLLLFIAHLGCCLLPLLAIAGGTIPYFSLLDEYNFLLLYLQMGMMVYLSFRLARHYLGKARFHSSFDRAIYHIGWLVAAISLAIGYLEPFHNENQQIAQQQFQFFKTHRRIELAIKEPFNSAQLKEDIALIEGVGGRVIQVNETSFSLTYHTEVISRNEILLLLRERGYVVKLQE